MRETHRVALLSSLHNNEVFLEKLLPSIPHFLTCDSKSESARRVWEGQFKSQCYSVLSASG